MTFKSNCLFLSLITFYLLASQAYAYNSSASCTSCFNAKSTNKFCLQNWSSLSGYCCDRQNTSDYCSSSRYFCSDWAPNEAMKYNFCPYNQKLCYNKASEVLNDNSLHSGATSTKFGQDDVCSWKIKVSSDLYFNKKIYFKFNQVSYSTCYLAYGDSITSANNVKYCSTGDLYEIDADQHAFVVIIGTNGSAYAQFEYQLKDKLEFKWIVTIFSGSLFILLLIVGGLVVLGFIKCNKSLIQSNQSFWQKMAVEMSQIVQQTDKLKEHASTKQLDKYEINVQSIEQSIPPSVRPMSFQPPQVDMDRGRSAPIDNRVPLTPYNAQQNFGDGAHSVMNAQLGQVNYDQQPNRANSRPQPIRFNL